MRFSVEQQIGSFILNGTEAIVYLYNELIPTAWLSDSILLVILPFANFDSVTQWQIKYITTSTRLKIQRWNLIKSKKLIYEKIISR